jgi:hypothetical protein
MERALSLMVLLQARTLYTPQTMFKSLVRFLFPFQPVFPIEYH